MTTIRERHQTYRNDGREWCRAEGVIAPCDAAQALAAGDALAEVAGRNLRTTHGEYCSVNFADCTDCAGDRAVLDRWAEVTGPGR